MLPSWRVKHPFIRAIPDKRKHDPCKEQFDMTKIAKSTTFLASLALFGALLLPPPGQAADTAKQGTDSYTDYYVVAAYNPIKLGASGFATVDFSGVSSSDSGNPMFDHLAIHCLASTMMEADTGVNRGACVGVAPDGGQLFATYEIKFDAKGRVGTNTFIGGTGRYEGISGGGTIESTMLHGPDGKVMFVSHHKVQWKLP